MHVIPQSWSHLHILIGVFPSIGFVIVLGFYIAGIRAGSDTVRRTCLVLFGLLGLLSVPIYVSGMGSAASLSANPRYDKSAIAAHSAWGLAALAVLALTAAVALFEVWRSRHARRAVGDSFFLAAGLAAISFLLSVATDEFGWGINHRELASAVVIPDITTSQVWSHAHIVLNHVPTAGFVFALVFFATALAANNDLMKRGSLIVFVICGIAGVPTYVAGTAAMWALTQPPVPDLDVSKAVINAHRDMALWTLFGLAFTGGAAWLELWRFRAAGTFSRSSLNLILLFALVTLAIMTETGHRGGLINHPEIRLAGDVLRTDETIGISAMLETAMKDLIWFVPWQTVHFFGYCLIFASAFAVGMRVLGVWKSAPFAAMHQLLVLGFVGVLMNVASGMLMMFADSYRYVVSDIAFAPKIAFIVIGAVAVLYFSVSDRLWNVKAGEDAPPAAKWVAAAVLLAWAGVIVCGRLLPYL